MIYFISWNRGKTARALSERLSPLKGRLLRQRSLDRRLRQGHMVVNLGRDLNLTHSEQGRLCTDFLDPTGQVSEWLMNGSSLSHVKDKRECLRLLTSQGVQVPNVYLTRTEAQEAMQQGVRRIVQRDLLRAMSGKGVSVHDSPDTLTDAPLYVEYIPKTDEYRVHVVKGKVIDVQRKARSSDVPDEDVNWQVRNHQNGFIFMREGVTRSTVPEDVLAQSLKAIEVTGLDFGAVDIIWNQRRDKAYVLEINTSPGMTGTTLERYCQAFQAVHDGTEIQEF